MSKSKIQNPVVYKLDKESEVLYIKNFVIDSVGKSLFKELKNTVPWEFGTYNMFGKPIKTPRLLFAMRDKNVDITKSYSVTKSMEWTPALNNIKKQVEKYIGKHIQYAQLNYYRDGADYIGYHTDSEVQPGDIIASISLGETRKFYFRNKNDTKNRIDLMLENNSLLQIN